MTKSEVAHHDGWMTRINERARKNRNVDPHDYDAGDAYVFAQVRGSIRAGAVTEAALLDAARGRAKTAHEALSLVEGELFDGGLAFAQAHSSRRELCAVIAESCDDLDPERVRTYVQGGYSLGQIDGDAHSRVVYGKCRNQFLQAEKRIATKLVLRAGAFGGVGLACASRKDRRLDADDTASFSVYSSRSKLDTSTAKFGVLVANAIPEAEEYWRGAVALVPASGANSDWGSAVAWLRDGKVVRVLVNVTNDDKLGDLPAALAALYGSAGETKGTVTTWSLTGGVRARLDIGAAVSLTIEARDLTKRAPTSTVVASPSASSATRPSTAPAGAVGGATPPSEAPALRPEQPDPYN